MKIAICDDNQIELEKTEQIVKDFIHSNHNSGEILIKTFRSGLDLLDYMTPKINFDLFILDIIMPGINGMELAEEIRLLNKNAKIIFLTSSPEFAVSSYNVNAFFYFLKPVEKNKMIAVLEKALSSMKEEKSDSVLIKDKGCLTRVPLHTIEYIESIKHMLHFHLNTGETATCYGKMEEFLTLTAKDSRFIHCHRSFIVNLNYIANLEKNCFILSDKTIIPIARASFNHVKNAYIDYFFEKESGVI